METWKEIEGFNGKYLVSNEGRVYSNTTKKILKPQPLKHGYIGVWLYGNGGISGRNGKAYSIHRLVAGAFCEKREGATEVNHKNEIKWDNRAENLEWVTHYENVHHGTALARRSAKTRNNKHSKVVHRYDKLTGEYQESYPSVHEAARANGYRIGNICQVIAGTKKSAYGSIWTH